MKVYLNGRFVDEADAKISIDDRGFLFADGVYEVIHVYHGELFTWDRHMRRLAASLKAVRIEGIDVQSFDAIIDTLLQEFRGDEVRRGGSGEGSVYVEVTRGAHPRSHLFPAKEVPPTVVLWVRPADPVPAELVENGIAVMTVPDDRWSKVWTKTIGLLPNVLAKQRAHELGYQEAIFVRDGVVTECTSANLFIVKNGVVRTAPISNYILPGVTREVVLECAQEANIPVDLTPFGVDEVYAADEVFLTGTMTEVLPITRVDQVVIGRRAGAVTLRLLQLLHQKAGVVSTRS